MSKKDSYFDVIIAGGGLAGLSALFWCRELGLSAILLEKEPEFGGQLLRTYNTITNYLGIEGVRGGELRDIFVRQLGDSNASCVAAAAIVEADLKNKEIITSPQARYRGRTIFIATGVRRRRLGIAGEDEFYGRGVLESGVKAANEAPGKHVVIVGGGDAALENAVILSRAGAKVTLVHRRDDFTARQEFVQSARNDKNIELILNAEMSAIVGNKYVERVEIMHLSSGIKSWLEVDLVLIRVGVEPNTELFSGQIDRDNAGYVCIDADCATSLRGVFAGGDVASQKSKTIAAAVGHGAAAVRSILQELR